MEPKVPVCPYHAVEMIPTVFDGEISIGGQIMYFPYSGYQCPECDMSAGTFEQTAHCQADLLRQYFNRVYYC